MSKKEYHKVSLANRQIEVLIEIKNHGTVKDVPITFLHKTENGKGWFEAFYNDEKIIVPANSREILDFSLPKDLIGLSKDRIKDGINEYINRLLN